MAGGYAIPEVGEEAGWPDVGFMALMYRGLGPIRRIEELQPRIVQSWNSMWLRNPASGPQSIEPWPHQKNRTTAASNPAVLGWQVAPQFWRWGGGWLARYHFHVLNILSLALFAATKVFVESGFGHAQRVSLGGFGVVGLAPRF